MVVRIMTETETKQMTFKEYLMNQTEAVIRQTEKGAKLGIYVNDDIKFTFHDECFADFQEDFVIFYDKNTEANMCVRYDAIKMVQYMNDEIIEKSLEEMDIPDFLKELLK